MHISIEKGKTLIIRLMAVGPVVEGRAQRDVWFEVNGEVNYLIFSPLLPSRGNALNNLLFSSSFDRSVRCQ